jgi:hypothetical protein
MEVFNPETWENKIAKYWLRLLIFGFQFVAPPKKGCLQIYLFISGL